MELEEGDVILCTVDRIVGTTVFVNIENNKGMEGSLAFSEVAPGRIRNIRDYVVPKKKIVCKVLRLSKGRIELSLRRVNQEERKRVLDQYKQENRYISMLRSILSKPEAEKAVGEISAKGVYDFFQEAKTQPKLLEKIFSKKDAEKILSILQSEKPKKAEIRREIAFKSISPDGLGLIKDILSVKGDSEIEIRYISAGRYSLKSTSDTPKKADNELQGFLAEVEKKAKKHDIQFSILKK